MLRRLGAATILRLSILLVLAVSVAMPWSVGAQEPDNDNDPYDQETCSGISEDEMEATRAGTVQNPFGPIDMPDSSSRNGGNDPDAFSPFPNGSFQLPFELDFGGGGGSGTGGGGSGTFSFVPTYTNEEDLRANDSFYPEPQVSMQLATPTAVEGEDTVATVSYDSFSSRSASGQDFYTVAFVDGIFLNGYMAGGSKEALEEQRNSGADSARSDCGTYSRETQSDNDNDGMDDNWEIRHGLNPSDPGDAGQDPDQDGFVADTYRNLEGDVVQPAPLIAGAELGDGSFTNYEEFVLDTDPRSPDTDGDSYPDEADAVGFGQTIVKFPATKSLGEPAYNLHVIVVGITGKRNEDGEQLIKIDSAFKPVQTGTREKLVTDLRLVQPAAPGGTLQIVAEPSGSKQHDLLNTYRWSVDGTLVTAASGQGRRTFEFPIEQGTSVGTNLDVTLDVINFETGQIAKGATTVVVGDNVLLDYDPSTVESGSDVTVQALLTTEEPADSFLFNWSVDAQLDPERSGVGADTLTLPIEVRPGTELQVGVDIYRVTDSALIASTSTELTTLVPEVTLAITPTQPQAGQQIVAQATADYFASDTLQYSFILDGTPLAADGPLITLPGQSAGEHRLGVQVRSVEPPVSSAATELTFAVAETQTVAAAVINSRGNTPLASLASTSTLGGIAAVGLGVVLVMLVRMRMGTNRNVLAS